MGKEYLIDFISSVIDTKPIISVINKIELLSLTETPQSIKHFLSDATILPLEDFIVTQTIEVRRKHRMKLPDAIIAATAIIYRKTLITRNIKDFAHIKGLRLLNPHE